MNIRGALLACALACTALPVSADVDPAAPPAGISSTSITLTHLLALHRVATGRINPGTARTRKESWAYGQGKLAGTIAAVYRDDDFREDVTLGPFHTARGELSGKKWEQNENGLVRALSGIHERSEVNGYALAHPLLKESGVQLLGVVNEPSRSYVVKVAPKNGRVEYVYYDAATYLIVRDEFASEGRRVVRTYDDYRITKGLKESWHIHESNGLPEDDRDWKLQSLTVGDAIDAATLAIPPGRDPVSLNANRVLMPATISGDRIVITVTIGTHKVNLLMDSGASRILLNRDVADATGVRSFGEKTEVTAGVYAAADALIPKIDLGVGTMQNVYAETAPYSEWTYGDIPVAGLMGYDFIAGSVIHIDYLHKTVEALAPTSFVPPAGAIALPIRLDDGVPVIEATVGTALGSNFVVDTGADRSMIFSGFADLHSADLIDQGLGEQMTDALPFRDKILGVGGKVEVRPVQVSSLTIGSIHLPDWLFYVSQNAPSFEGEDYDGLIGQDVLRNFDVYFDYAHYVLYLMPNDRYRQRWGS